MRRVRRIVALILVHAFLLAGAAFVLLPFVWMLVTSIKPPDEIFTATLRLWPRNFAGVENYTRALTSAPLLRFGLNGLIVCAGILVVQLLVAIPCAYALAKLRFPGRNVLFVLTLLVLAIPVQVPALPLYIALANMDLSDTTHLTIKVDGASPRAFTGEILTSAAMHAHNTFDKPDAVKPAVFKGARVKDGAVQIDVPPKSIIVLSEASK
jgi:ABC-type glycerol-3-phosphate transport system permease component